LVEILLKLEIGQMGWYRRLNISFPNLGLLLSIEFSGQVGIEKQALAKQKTPILKTICIKYIEYQGFQNDFTVESKALLFDKLS
jgi:hypothetical protein